MGRSIERSTSLSETRKYRKFTAQQKIEIVLASLRGTDRWPSSVASTTIAETLLRRWREQLLEAGAERFAARRSRSAQAGAAQAGRRARAGAWSQDLRAGDRGKALAGVGVSMRVARSRELVAAGYSAAVVARVAQISRQAIYRTPKPGRAPSRRAARRPTRSSGRSSRSPRPTRPTATGWSAALVRRKLGGRSTASACCG